MNEIRKPAVSGTFYPANKEELKEMVDSFLKKTEKIPIDGKIKGIIVPHAGYVYSGLVASKAYKMLSELKNKFRIIILGPTHFFPFSGAALSPFKYWQTPLGKVECEKIDTEKLNAQHILTEFSEPHLREHSIEVQLPFLQRTMENFTIIPIVLGSINYKILAEKISPLINKNTIIIASSDLSHFHPYKEAIELDKNTIKGIENLEFSKLIENAEACGKTCILTLMNLAKERGWKIKLLDYKNSGDITKIKEEVVGYSSFIVYD